MTQPIQGGTGRRVAMYPLIEGKRGHDRGEREKWSSHSWSSFRGGNDIFHEYIIIFWAHGRGKKKGGEEWC